MTNKDLIKIHLTLKDYVTPDGRKIQSCLTAGLNEARYLTARDTNTGKDDPQNKHGHRNRWTGAMCYMTVLDQIGSCYRPKNKTAITDSCCLSKKANKKLRASAIEKALRYFTDLGEREICALYALRNAFFHDFALVNNNNDRPCLQHVFLVDAHETNPIVILPENNWDGKMSSRNSKNATYVNLQAVGDLVEKIYQNLLELHDKKQLAVELEGGEDELINRYSFSY